MSTLIMISMSYVTCLVMVGYHNRWGEFDFTRWKNILIFIYSVKEPLNMLGKIFEKEL